MGDDYDDRLKQVQERNDFILGHFVHVWRGRISDDTLYRHVLNIQSFTDIYLNYYAGADELRSGDQASAWKVYDFITDGGESPEAFRARMQELEERWKAIHQKSRTGAQDP